MGPIILIDTLIYAFITILGVGSILNPTLAKLGVKRKEGGGAPELDNDDLAPGQQSCSDNIKAKLSKFNQTKIAPIFVK